MVFRLCAIAAVSYVIYAQVPKAPEPLKLGNVTVQGSFRSRLETWDFFQGEANNAYAFSGNILRLSFSQAKKNFDWQIELAAPFLLGLPDDAIAPGAQGQLSLGATYFAGSNRQRNAGMVFPKQAFIRLKGEEHALRIGRFEFSDGAEMMPADPTLGYIKRERMTQRLIGPFAWSHTGRSFDGLNYTWTRGRTNFTGVAALPTRGAFQVDGWGNLNIGLGYGALTRQHGGKNHLVDWRAFGIYYQDWRNNVVKTDNRPLPLRRFDGNDIRIGTFGGHVIHRSVTKAGTFDTLGWLAAQTGKWGMIDHRATAWAVEGGWQPKVLPSLKPWLRVGYFHGSGDNDPLDGRHGTFFQILPTPRPYARMPFFDFLNNQDLMAMLVLRPHKAITIRPEVHGLRLANRNDMWYIGGGAFQPWTFGYTGRPSNGNRGLATMYDLSVDYNVHAKLTISGYVAHAVGQSVVHSIFPRGKDATFAYLEAVYRF